MSEAPAPSSKDSDTNTELVAAFKVFDKDNSGSVSPSELRQVLLSLGQRATDEEIEEMIRGADLDGNGSIDCRPTPNTANVYPCLTRSHQYCQWPGAASLAHRNGPASPLHSHFACHTRPHSVFL